MSARRRRLVATAVGVAAACVLAGTVVASQFDDGSALSTAIDDSPMEHVADIPGENGTPALGVFVQRTSTGHVCVWEAPSATSRQRGGGCNTADDPLNGRPTSFTLSFDGGPAIERVSTATVFGLAATVVDRMGIVMSDGSMRPIRLRPAKVGSEGFQAFGHRIRRSDLKQGVGPVAIVAWDADGVEIDRQPTGIG